MARTTIPSTPQPAGAQPAKTITVPKPMDSTVDQLMDVKILTPVKSMD